MRVSSIVLISLVSIGVAACGGDPADEADAGDAAFADGGAASPGLTGADSPTLRAGLWEIASTDEDGGSSMTVCVDDAVQEKMSLFGTSLTAAWCGNTDIRRRALGGWTAHAACSPVAGTEMAIDTVITGDLRNSFHSEMKITENGVDEDGPTVAEGRYQGACPAGMAPGDFTDSEGTSGNLVELAAGMEAMGQMMKNMRAAGAAAGGGG